MTRPTPARPSRDDDAILAAARDVLAEARGCLDGAAARLGADFCAAARALARRDGFTVVLGVGKSGHIGRKIAASLVSTGHRAAFVHPVEALHGDLGLADQATLALLLSHSGATEELLALVPSLAQFRVPVALITRRRDCALAGHAAWVIETGVAAEAGLHRLAPTSSTTTTLALGDALMMASLALRGFSAEEFRRFHPGGALGRRLLRVADVMTPLAATPWVAPDASLYDVLAAMPGRLGLAIVSARAQGPGIAIAELGVISEGDIRRAARARQPFDRVCARDVMSTDPKSIVAEAFAIDALRMMEQHRITVLLVAD
ncbi:MAG: KpsF/GutQ family sugar-phosphate isomerase, partial [Alphaproteobacteria bacterium]